MDAARAFPAPHGLPPDGLILLLPARAGDGWRWWRVEQGRLGRERSFMPDAESAPWGSLEDGSVVTALVPAAMAPVRPGDQFRMAVGGLGDCSVRFG